MTTAIDSNVLVTALDTSQDLQGPVAKALEEVGAETSLAICAPVYAELMAYPGRGRKRFALDAFLADTEIAVDWELEEAVWRLAGAAFQLFAQRRRDAGSSHPRRILADFLIGAHAQVNGYSLLTLDQRHYRVAFPRLKLRII